MAYYMVLGAILWVFFSLIPAFIALRKGYSFWIFWLISLFFWWITLFVTLLLQNRLTTNEQLREDG